MGGGLVHMLSTGSLLSYLRRGCTHSVLWPMTKYIAMLSYSLAERPSGDQKHSSKSRATSLKLVAVVLAPLPD